MTTTQTEFPVSITPEATHMALSALNEMGPEEGEFLRISIQGGGCAGFKYALNFVKETDEYDLSLNQNGLKVVMDIFTGVQIAGTTVNYVEGVEGAGFKFENPKAKRTCGCGSSFSG